MSSIGLVIFSEIRDWGHLGYFQSVFLICATEKFKKYIWGTAPRRGAGRGGAPLQGPKFGPPIYGQDDL